MTVARVLVLGDTRTNRRRLEAHAAMVRAVLPAGTRDITRWVADPIAPAPAMRISTIRRNVSASAMSGAASLRKACAPIVSRSRPVGCGCRNASTSGG